MLGIGRPPPGGCPKIDRGLSGCQENARLGLHRGRRYGQAQDRVYPHRRRRVLQGGARRSHPSGRARPRLRMDGGAPLGDESLLAVAAHRARRLRDAHLADDARHRHRRRRLPPSRTPRRGRRDARRDVRRAHHARHRDRVQAGRVRALRRRAGEARRQVRGAASHHEGPLDPGAGELQGHILYGRR